jgi:RNA polymerase sigma-70 factor (ECF subfamily)
LAVSGNLLYRAPDLPLPDIWWIGGTVMPWSAEDERDYLRLLAGILWKPGLQRRLEPSDVVQRTLLIAQQKLDQFQGDCEEQWRGWLRAILLNELRQELRRAARDNKIFEASLNESSRNLEEVIAADHSSPSEHVLGPELLEQLAKALGQLLEDERTAVELKYIHGCSVAFISQHVGRTGDAVGGLLKRGMRKLRRLLQDRGEEKG